jgi:site-specific recombinase XerC
MQHVEKNVAPHSARKAFAVEEFKHKGIAAAQKALQHSDLSTTLLYCLSDTSFMENNEKINARIDALFEKLDNIEKMLTSVLK